MAGPDEAGARLLVRLARRQRGAGLALPGDGSAHRRQHVDAGAGVSAGRDIELAVAHDQEAATDPAGAAFGGSQAQHLAHAARLQVDGRDP